MPLLESDFIFSQQWRHRISRHVVFWLFCVVFFVLIYGSMPTSSRDHLPFVLVSSYRLSLFEALAYLPQHIFLSYLFMYLFIPRYLLQGRYWSFLAGLTLASLLVALLSYFTTLFLVVPFREHLGLHAPTSNFFFGLMAGLRGGLSVAGFAGAIKLAKHWYYKNQLNQQLEAGKLKAELQLLKAQVHPHFLFNTLNNLYSLTLQQSSQAPEVVLKLAGLLRYMLYECNAPQVSLNQEIKLLQDYIELEKLRYGERLDLSVNIRGQLTQHYIAPLLLLPFLENSFKHGASEQLEQAWVSLDIVLQGDSLQVKVMNALPETSAQGGLNRGIGLANVQKRLNLLYPNQYKLKIRQEQETFLVVLTLTLQPLRENREPQPAPAPAPQFHKPFFQPDT